VTAPFNVLRVKNAAKFATYALTLGREVKRIGKEEIMGSMMVEM
jgi:hypothetical protein